MYRVPGKKNYLQSIYTRKKNKAKLSTHDDNRGTTSLFTLNLRRELLPEQKKLSINVGC
jgi:hypothetical protein